MKTIGLIGGMSWESSLEYYRIINEEVKKRLGGFHSAECLLYSFDFQTVEKLQHEGNWGKLTELMVQAAQKIEKGGAECCIPLGTHNLCKSLQEIQGISLYEEFFEDVRQGFWFRGFFFLNKCTFSGKPKDLLEKPHLPHLHAPGDVGFTEPLCLDVETFSLTLPEESFGLCEETGGQKTPFSMS